MVEKREHEAGATAVEASIVRDVLSIALPVSWAAAALFLVIGLALGMATTQPTRLIPQGLALVLLTAGLVARRAGRPRFASAALLVAVLAATASGMVLNSGLRAPVAHFTVLVVVASTWVLGRRASVWVASGACGFGLVIYLLDRRGELPTPGAAPLELELAVYFITIWLLWAASAIPHQRMREATIQAADRHRALLEEQARRKDADLAFKAVLDQSAHYLLVVDAEGTVLSANRGALGFMQLQRDDEVVGRRLLDTSWCSAEAKSALDDCFRNAVRTAKPARFQAAVPASGRTRIIDHSITPYIEDTGRLRHLIVEGRDVTEIVEAHERQSRARRLDLVGQLAGGVAHDFNNSLLAILSAGELLELELGGTLSPEHREHLQTIIGSAHRAADLTKRLLEVGRQSSLDKKQLSLHALVSSVATLLRRTFSPNIKLELRLLATADGVHADAAALESALLNLALNARDAMPDGGSLVLETESVELDAAWCAASGFDVAPGRYLRLSVRDTGVGIPPQLQSRVFEPFFTTKPEGKSSGLGLASVFGVVVDHKGAIHLVSEPGRGTVFQLVFPLVDPPASAPLDVAPAGRPAGPSLERAPGLSLAGMHALIVDDEPAIRRLLSRQLARAGVTCAVAGDAESGLEEFLKAPSSFSFAVLDLVLPGRRGSELAVDLLRLAPDLKVLLVSGFPKDAEVESLPSARVRMLGKPFTVEALQGALQELLQARQ